MFGNTADLEDVLFVLAAVDATGNSDDCTGLACSWRAVEEKMRNAVLLNKLFDWVKSCQSTPSLSRGGLLVEVMSLWDTTSSSVIGLYFSTLYRYNE